MPKTKQAAENDLTERFHLCKVHRHLKLNVLFREASNSKSIKERKWQTQNWGEWFLCGRWEENTCGISWSIQAPSIVAVNIREKGQPEPGWPLRDTPPLVRYSYPRHQTEFDPAASLSTNLWECWGQSNTLGSTVGLHPARLRPWAHHLASPTQRWQGGKMRAARTEGRNGEHISNNHNMWALPWIKSNWTKK